MQADSAGMEKCDLDWMNTEPASEDRRSDLKTRKMKRRDGPRSEGWEQGRSLQCRRVRERAREREREVEGGRARSAWS